MQFSVNGPFENSPFVLSLSEKPQSFDNWRTTQQRLAARRGFMFNRSPMEPESIGELHLSTNQIEMIRSAISKSRQWGEIANKEDLEVEAKELLAFTNMTLKITFNKAKSATNYTLCISVPFKGTYASGSCRFTIDKSGIERLDSVLSTLGERRRKFMEFDERDKSEELRRIEAQRKEKARIDELLR